MARAPAGSCVPPLPLTPTGAGTLIPSADPTVAAVGHEREAAVGEGTAGGVDALGGVAAVLVLLQADKEAATRSAVKASRRGLTDDTVARC